MGKNKTKKQAPLAGRKSDHQNSQSRQIQIPVIGKMVGGPAQQNGQDLKTIWIISFG